jgi:hypothetical protein
LPKSIYLDILGFQCTGRAVKFRHCPATVIADESQTMPLSADMEREGLVSRMMLKSGDRLNFKFQINLRGKVGMGKNQQKHPNSLIPGGLGFFYPFRHSCSFKEYTLCNFIISD